MDLDGKLNPKWTEENFMFLNFKKLNARKSLKILILDF